MSVKSLSAFEKKMMLTISSWTKADEAHYVCKAANSLGVADARIQAYSEKGATIQVCKYEKKILINF